LKRLKEPLPAIAVPQPQQQQEQSALVTLQSLGEHHRPVELSSPDAAWLLELGVHGKLGAGSFGTVFEVDHSGRRCALKEIGVSKLRDDSHRQQIQQEVEIHRGLSHPHVLCCYESLEVFGVYFVLLELCAGGELYEYMQKQGVLQVSEAVSLWTEMTNGVIYLHSQGVMHRDIKPENVLLDENHHAKLCDFGFVARIPKTGLCFQECGSLAYMSPEMVLASGYDQRVDVWALGIMFFEMFTGLSPFKSAFTEKETRRKIGDMDWCEEAWARVPGAAHPLIKSLLRRSLEERCSLSGALSDPWLLAQS